MSAIGNKEIFARNLSRHLQKSGRSQREMADIVGVSSSTFNEWMRAKKYPRIDKIEVMANFFGINKSDLIEDNEGQKNPSDEIELTEGEKAWIKLLRRFPAEQKAILLERILSELDNQE
jgi:transcriptional regulator with XRE-family HTH domain